MSGGVSVLCWLAAPVAMLYGNLQNLVIKSKSAIKSSSVISSQIGVMSDRWECVIVYGHVPECHIMNDSCESAEFLVRNGCVKGRKIKGLDACDMVEIGD